MTGHEKRNEIFSEVRDLSRQRADVEASTLSPEMKKVSRPQTARPRRKTHCGAHEPSARQHLLLAAMATGFCFYGIRRPGEAEWHRIAPDQAPARYAQMLTR
jgi:hypothetical protein